MAKHVAGVQFFKVRRAVLQGSPLDAAFVLTLPSSSNFDLRQGWHPGSGPRSSCNGLYWPAQVIPGTL